jgi:hypothetical protein
LILLTRGKTVIEAENTANTEMTKISSWATANKIHFNNSKSKAMLLSRWKRKQQKELYIFLNNRQITQLHSIKYLGIIFDPKLSFKDHINYITEKCSKLIFALAKSAKLNWGLCHTALRTIYTGAILPLLQYRAPVWINVIKNLAYKSKMIRVQDSLILELQKPIALFLTKLFASLMD